MSSAHPIDILLLLIAFLLLPILSVMARRSAVSPTDAKRQLRRYSTIIGRGVVISLVILLSWRWLGRDYAALGLSPPMNLRALAGFALDLLLLGYFGYTMFFQKLSGDALARLRSGLAQTNIAPRSDKALALFPVVGVIGAITEELLYRGYLLWAMAPVFGLAGAIMMSSLAFGMAHAYQGWAGVARATLLGILFAVGFALTQSLWWLMLAHIVMNQFGGLYARKLYRLTPV